MPYCVALTAKLRPSKWGEFCVLVPGSQLLLASPSRSKAAGGVRGAGVRRAFEVALLSSPHEAGGDTNRSATRCRPMLIFI
jgi:hypothetical protein